MKHIKILFSSLSIFILSVFIMSGVAFANPATVTLSTANSTYPPGSTITVNIFINTNSSSVITAGIQVTYDSSKVSFVSVDESGSAFSGGGIPVDTTGSYIGINKYQISGINGSNLYFAKINFLANTAGTANFGLTASTQVANSSGTNIYSSNGSAGKSVTIQASPPPAQLPATPETPTTNSPNTSNTSTPSTSNTTSSQPASNPIGQSNQITSSPSNETTQPLNASTTPSVASDGTVNQPVNVPEEGSSPEEDDLMGILDYAATITNPVKNYALPVVAVIAIILTCIFSARYIIKHTKNFISDRKFNKSKSTNIQDVNPVTNVQNYTPNNQQSAGNIINPENLNDKEN